MKKNILYLLLIPLTVLISCTEEDLNLTPKGLELESSFYQNDAQLEQALWAAYDPLQWLIWGGSPYLWGSVGSDDSYAGGSDPTDQDSYQLFDVYNLGPVEAGDDNMMQMWRSRFRINYRSNLIIKYSDDSKTSGKEAIGHAYFLKAYAYFELTRLWGGMPIIDDVDAEARYARSTQEETWAAIERYCIEAISRLPLKPAIGVDNGMGLATKGSAQFLLGKVYLYQKKYSDAIDVLEDLVASNKYELEDVFSDVFNPGNRYGKESIFEINFSDQVPPGGNDWGQTLAGNVANTLCGPRTGEITLPADLPYEWGWGFNQPTQSLVGAYLAMNDNVRLQRTIIFSDTILAHDLTGTLGFQNEKDGYWDYKHSRIRGFFIGGDAQRVNMNIIVMRLADAYLMLAEAYNQNGNDTKALEYLNEVRQRVDLPAETGSGSGLLEKIKLERRLELALEGDRYFDLVRWGDAENILGPLGYTNGTPGKSTNGLLPIPYPEITATLSEVPLEQNEGY
ncbi:MAG: RagB/SusD family nutrient uptake outer membrane protein [Bacteroidales bacterium]|nr:RagB/SusD family nutrient uptake outer membrane protein [Bacteroidales bacterium]